MDERERKIFEMGLRNKISYNEERLREVVIEEAKILLEIVEDAVKSQDPEVLKGGLDHCCFLYGIITVSGIKHDEINSSEKEIESLINEIAEKWLASSTPILVAEVRTENPIEIEMDDLFKINLN